MKLFFRKHKLLIISVLFLLICITYVLIKYKIDYNSSLKEYERVLEYLAENPEKSQVLKNNNLFPKKPIMYDAYTLFMHIVTDKLLILIWFIPFIIMLNGMYDFHSKLKSGFFKDECMRRGYKKNLIINFLSSWKSVVIIPIYIVLTFIGCYIVTGNLDINRTLNFYGYSLIDYKYISMLPQFYGIYLLNLIFIGIFFINIALIICKKNNNLFIALIQSYLIYIIIDIILSILCVNILLKLFPSLVGSDLPLSLDINSFWVYDSVISLWFMICFAFLLCVISTIVLYIKYRNKEGVMIEIDK